MKTPATENPSLQRRSSARLVLCGFLWISHVILWQQNTLPIHMLVATTIEFADAHRPALLYGRCVFFWFDLIQNPPQWRPYWDKQEETGRAQRRIGPARKPINLYKEVHKK